MARAYNTDWQSRSATKAAVDKFEAEFAKSMGVDLKEVNDDYETISSGSLNLDYALGIGGIPTGRIGEIWGPEHAGKTTICMLIVAEFQRRFPRKKVAWVDMEQTFDPEWATKLGVDVKAMWRPPVKTAEDTADATKKFVESGLCSLVILDSVGGMIAKMEFQKEADEATVGLVPKIVTRMVKQCSPMAKSNGTSVIVVNQVRGNIGYGADETTGGGWALKHVTSWKLQVKRAGGSMPRTIPVDGVQIPCGHQMAIKVQKNKMAPYGQTAYVWLHNRASKRWGPIGVDVVSETFDFAKRLKLMGDKAGGYYNFKEDPTDEVGVEVRGEDKAKEYLVEHPTVVEGLRKVILKSLVSMQENEIDAAEFAELAKYDPDASSDESGADELGIADMAD